MTDPRPAFDTIHFVTREASYRPAMAFVRRVDDSAEGDPPEPPS